MAKETGPDQEAAYQSHLTDLTLSRLRATALLIIAMVLIDAAAHYFLDPQLFTDLFWVRLAAVTLSLGLWAFCWRPQARQFTFAIGLALTCIISADLETAIIVTSGYNSPFQTGLALLIVGAGLLVPFPPRKIILICLLVWVVFLGPLLTGSQHISSHEPGFTASALFMMCATLITIASGVMTSRLRRDEFFGRMALAAEKEKSEQLLLNILPAPIAERLKTGEEPISDSLEDISVLFADIEGFTALANSMSAAKLVGMLNSLFSSFDELVEMHALEKIKTIGDAYMAVGGAPVATSDHMQRIADLALDMLEATDEFNRSTGRDLHIRIGLHCGPAVAGVIGLNKFNYDLWGDTVNTASRMESHGLPGRIQVTGAVYRRLQVDYVFDERGDIDIKGKGTLHTWLLNARVPELRKPANKSLQPLPRPEAMSPPRP